MNGHLFQTFGRRGESWDVDFFVTWMEKYAHAIFTCVCSSIYLKQLIKFQLNFRNLKTFQPPNRDYVITAKFSN